MRPTNAQLDATAILNYLTYLDLRTESRCKRLLFEAGASADNAGHWAALDHLPAGADINTTDPGYFAYLESNAQRRVIKTIAQYIDSLVEDDRLDRTPDGKSLAVGS